MPTDAAAPVTDVHAAAYRVPTDAPEADGTLAWEATTMVVVRVAAGDDTGAGWTFAPAAATAVVEELLAPVVRGADALAPADAQAAMVRAVRNAGRQGLVAMAISAVDIALWDLCARLHGVPLGQLWGRAPVPVPVYGSGGFTSYDDERLTSQLRGWCDLGLGAVKIKIGECWGRRQDRDLDRTRLAREVAGGEVDLFVDANGGYEVGQACRVGRRLHDLGVTWFEEPVSSDDRAGLRRVRESVAADVTAGEYGFDLQHFRDLVDAGSVDCLQVDVTRCGGYTEWLRVAALAATHHLEVSGHCAPYLTVPVAAATPNVRHLEWFHDHVRIARELVDGYADPVDGCLPASAGPGHGLAFKHEHAERWRVA